MHPRTTTTKKNFRLTRCKSHGLDRTDPKKSLYAPIIYHYKCHSPVLWLWGIVKLKAEEYQTGKWIAPKQKSTTENITGILSPFLQPLQKDTGKMWKESRKLLRFMQNYGIIHSGVRNKMIQCVQFFQRRVRANLWCLMNLYLLKRRKCCW